MGQLNKMRAEIRSFEFTDARLRMVASRYVVEDHPEGQVLDFECFKMQSPGAVVIRGRGRVRLVNDIITVTQAEVILFEWKKKTEPGEFGFSLTS